MTIFQKRELKLFVRILAIGLALLLICSNPVGAFSVLADEIGDAAQSSGDVDHSNPNNNDPEGTPPEDGNPEGTPPEDGNPESTPPEDGNPEGTPLEDGNPEGTPFEDGNPESTPFEDDDTDKTVDIEGIVVFLGTETIGSEELGLTLYVNGEADPNAVPVIEPMDDDEFEGWQYLFSELPLSDEDGSKYSYAVKAGETGKNGVGLYYIVDDSVICEGNDTPKLPADLVFAGETDLSGTYRVEKNANAPSPEDVYLTVGTLDENDAEFLNAKETALSGGDTGWRIDGLLQYNPITKSEIEYYVQVSQNAEDYEAAYTNIEPYHDETQYACQGGTVVNRYTGIAPEPEEEAAQETEAPTDEEDAEETDDSAATDDTATEIQAIAAIIPFGAEDEAASYEVETKNFETKINWNDNSIASNRPDSLNLALTRHYKLSDGTTGELTEKILESWEVDPDTIAAIMEAAPAPTVAKSGNYWTYTYADLPAKITKTIGEGSEADIGDICEIYYSYALTADAETAVADKQYLIDYLEPPVEGVSIRCTTQAEYKITKVWKDGADKYKTRPENGDTLLENLEFHFEIITGETPITGEVDLDELGENPVTITKTDDEWTLTITGLHAFTDKGIPIYYHVTEKPLALKDGNEFEKDGADTTVHYATTYENIGNFTERKTSSYNGGKIINTLEDTATYTATKIWQDDNQQGTVEARPAGTLILMRFPDRDGRTYHQATPVVGMEMPLVTNQKTYTIDFSELDEYPEDGLPFFDIDGYEYVYFVQEVFPLGANGYVRFIGEGTEASPYDERKANVLYKDEILNNRLTGTTTKSATKTWNAVAKQSMSASITLLLERRMKGSEGAWDIVQENVPLSGFRAEEMTKTHAFSGLDKYNEQGLEYEYRVTEQSVTVDGKTVELKSDEWLPSGDSVYQQKVIDGYAYKLESKTNTDGSVQLTNTLQGKTEVRIKKVWNVSPIPADKNAVFTISGGGNTYGPYTYNSASGWIAAAGQPAFTENGDWLIVPGFERYDATGREYEYTVKEDPIAEYTSTESTNYTEELTAGEGSEKKGIVETTVINTPVGEGGRGVTVTKQWADDGDETCRGPVVVELFHSADGSTGWAATGITGTLTRGNDWTAWLPLHNGSSTGSAITDQEYNHYYAREISVKEVAVDYEAAYDDEPLLTTVNSPRIGAVKTNEHNYDVFITVHTKTGAEIKANNDDTENHGPLGDTTDYRTSYTFKNVRTGLVDIKLKKEWQDEDYHVDTVESVTLAIYQRLLGGNIPEADGVKIPYKIATLNAENSWGDSETGKGLPKYNENGKLYLYSIAETDVIAKSGSTFEWVTAGESFTLDNHTYTVGVEADIKYGEHTNERETPQADDCTYTVTNGRSQTITGFKVYKIWQDITRTKNVSAANALIEAKKRPAIYLTLQRTIDGVTEAIPDNEYVERVWSTMGTHNEYFWMCTFDPLPRYENGKEIIYSVVENNISGYETEYYNLAAGKEPVNVSTVDSAKATELEAITEIPIYTLPNGAGDATKVEDENPAVLNGGVIINRRADTRFLTGVKTWTNVPPAVSPADIPEITLELQQQKGYDGNEYIAVPDVARVTLKNKNPSFEFGTGETKLPKYDEYGVYIKYRAAEVSLTLDGYQAPQYDDYLLEITNVYDLDGETVNVTVQKNWVFPENFTLSEEAYPTAKFTLYQVMSGENISTKPEILSDQSIVYDPEGTNKTVVFENLPKYGYNGLPFTYYVEESINGYKVTGLETDDAVVDEDGNFTYEITNTYNGTTDTGDSQYIKLHGKKVWNDQNNDYGTRPDPPSDGIALEVWRSVGADATHENITGKVTITWDSEWGYDITANHIDTGETTDANADGATLYHYAPNGKAYVYYVKEAANPFDTSYHYTLAHEKTAAANGTVPNLTNTLKMVECSVAKLWMKKTDGNNTTALTPAEFEMMLPESITFQVQYYDGDSWEAFDYKGADKLTLTKAECIELLGSTNQMAVKVKDLPKYNLTAPQEAAQYRLVETEVTGGKFEKNEDTSGTNGKTINITNTLETIKLTIKKDWDDEDNQDGLRMESITFKIVRDDVSLQTISVDLTNGNWTDWKDNGITVYVPKFKDNATTPSIYTVEEMLSDDEKKNYTLKGSAEGDYTLADTSATTDAVTGAKTYEFENVHGTRKIDVSVTKVWSDSTIGTTVGTDEVENIRPASVTVKLQRSSNGTTWLDMDDATNDTDWQDSEESATAVLNATNNWTAEWTGLQSRHNHTTSEAGGNNQMIPYQFRVVEVPTPYGYTSAVTKAGGENGYVTDADCGTGDDADLAGLTLTNTLETTSLTVTKAWANNPDNNPFAPKPDVEVQLLYRLAGSGTWLDGAAKYTLNSAENWTHTFTGLPTTHKDGTAYEYSFKEIKVGDVTVANDYAGGYDVTYNADKATTVTNTLVTRTDITVTKVWNDADNQDGVRPESVEVKLYKDKGITGEEKLDTVTLEYSETEAENWKHTWENLPRYQSDGITECIYTVEETAINIATHSSNPYTVTYAGGTGTGSNEVTEDADDPDTDVREVTITNSYTPVTMKITAAKDWEDGSYASELRPEAIKLQLMWTTNSDGVTDAVAYTVEGVENPVEIAGQGGVKTATWTTATWENLPIMAVGEVGEKIYYSVVELKADGTAAPIISYENPIYNYTTSSNGEVIEDDDDKAVALAGSVKDAAGTEHNATVTNNIAITEFHITKVWVNDANTTFKEAEPTEVSVQLIRRLLTNPPGEWEDVSIAVSLNEGNNWRKTIDDLPTQDNAGIHYEYSVRETEIGGTPVNTDGPTLGYTGVVTADTGSDDSCTVTNTFALRGITVTKVWDDADNQDGVRPESVEVTLYKDKGITGEEKLDTVTLAYSATEAENWKHTWENLPKYRSDGELCVYTVEETAINISASSSASYTTKYKVGEDGTAQDTCADITADRVTITNKYTPVTMSITAKKQWTNDTENTYTTRPATLTYTLKKTVEGVTSDIESVTVSAATSPNAWEHTWSALPVMEVGKIGKAIQYEIVETPVTGYNTTYSSTDITGSILTTANNTPTVTITNTLKIIKLEVEKVWGDDYGNLYESRPDEITFKLQKRTGTTQFADAIDKDGNVIQKKMQVDTAAGSAASTQSITFEKLPELAPNGEKWEYRAIEAAVDGGTLTANTGGLAGTIITGDGFEYTFESSPVPVSNDYKTTVNNTLTPETVSIQGTKEWKDEDNVFGARPDKFDLDLNLYYDNGGAWALYTSLDSGFILADNIVWKDGGNDNKWDYEITNLLKYRKGTKDQITYAVTETSIEFYEQIDSTGNTVTGTDLYQEGSVEQNTRNVTGADFINRLVKDEVPLVVKKVTDFGPPTMTFEFQVIFGKTAADAGTVYKGDYMVYAKNVDIADIIGDPPAASGTLKTATDGIITITPTEQFVIKDIPTTYYYNVIELAHDDYDLEKTEIKVNDTPTATKPYHKGNLKGVGVGGDVEKEMPIVISVENKAKREIGIANVTVNETESYADQNVETIGGKVIVGAQPEDYVADSTILEDRWELGVAWTPSKYWTFGNKVKISYTDFGDKTEKTAEIINFSYANGTTSLVNMEFTNIADKVAFLKMYPKATFTMHDGIVLLTFGDDVSEMPRKTWVDVQFEPTLAVRNITPNQNEKNGVGGIGGTVQVENGKPSNRSDGLPDDGANPYGKAKVYGTADEGYQLDMTKAVVRNLNDLNGPSAKLEVSGLNIAPMSARSLAPAQLTAENFAHASISAFNFSNLTIAPLASTTENGTFTARIPTQINPTSNGSHVDTYVDISGDVVLTKDAAGNITAAAFDLSGLPVPLQIDLLFVPIPVDDNNPPDDNNNNNNNNHRGNSGGGNTYNNGNRPLTDPPKIAKPIMSEAEPPDSDMNYDSANINEPSPQTSDDAPIAAVAVLAVLSAMGALITKKKPREKKL